MAHPVPSTVVQVGLRQDGNPADLLRWTFVDGLGGPESLS